MPWFYNYVDFETSVEFSRLSKAFKGIFRKVFREVASDDALDVVDVMGSAFASLVINLLYKFVFINAPDCNISEYDRQYIAEVTRWPLEPSLLFDVLIDTGFLIQTDDGLIVFDWHESMGHRLRVREQDAKRKYDERKQRLSYEKSIDNIGYVNKSDGFPQVATKKISVSCRNSTGYPKKNLGSLPESCGLPEKKSRCPVGVRIEKRRDEMRGDEMTRDDKRDDDKRIEERNNIAIATTIAVDSTSNNKIDPDLTDTLLPIGTISPIEDTASTSPLTEDVSPISTTESHLDHTGDNVPYKPQYNVAVSNDKELEHNNDLNNKDTAEPKAKAKSKGGSKKGTAKKAATKDEVVNSGVNYHPSWQKYDPRGPFSEAAYEVFLELPMVFPNCTFDAEGDCAFIQTAMKEFRFVSLVEEFKKAFEWGQCNPKRAAQMKNIRQFLRNWLKRANDSNVPQNYFIPA